MKNYAHFIYMHAKHTKNISNISTKSRWKLILKAWLNPSKHSINSYNILHFTKREMIFANTDLSQNRKTWEITSKNTEANLKNFHWHLLRELNYEGDHPVGGKAINTGVEHYFSDMDKTPPSPCFMPKKNMKLSEPWNMCSENEKPSATFSN